MISSSSISNDLGVSLSLIGQPVNSKQMHPMSKQLIVEKKNQQTVKDEAKCGDADTHVVSVALLQFRH